MSTEAAPGGHSNDLSKVDSRRGKEKKKTLMFGSFFFISTVRIAKNSGTRDFYFGGQ